MGKLRAKRRAAERAHHLDGQDSAVDLAMTSAIDAPISTICASERSATSITNHSNTKNNDDDDETLAASLEALTVADSAQQSKKTGKKSKSKPAAVPCSLPSPPLSPPPMAVARAVPLLICSVGNPGSTYANTLHSAGHTVLKKLSERLEFQPYQKSRPHGSGLVSKPLAPSDGDWTLWQLSLIHI